MLLVQTQQEKYTRRNVFIRTTALPGRILYCLLFFSFPSLFYIISINLNGMPFFELNKITND